MPLRPLLQHATKLSTGTIPIPIRRGAEATVAVPVLTRVQDQLSFQFCGCKTRGAVIECYKYEGMPMPSISVGFCTWYQRNAHAALYILKRRLCRGSKESPLLGWP
jgi:hypothetical protein